MGLVGQAAVARYRIPCGECCHELENQADGQAFIQLVAATIFWISTLTGLPGVIRGLYGDDGSMPIIDIFFWTPQGIFVSCLTEWSLTISRWRNRLYPLFRTSYARNATQVVQAQLDRHWLVQ
jgi:hypothetical protein